MKKKTLLLAASITLVTALIFIYGIYGLRARQRADAGTARDLLSLAPADATMVAYADVAALRNSPLVQHLASMAQPATVDLDYAEFVRATGFDYQRDLDRLLVAGRTMPTTKTVVFADGRFDHERIEQYALRSGKAQDQNGRRMLVLPSAKTGKKISLTFLTPGRIALFDEEEFAAPSADATGAPWGLVSSASPRSDENSSALQARIARVSGAPLFAVGKVPASAQDPNSLSGLPPAALPFAALRWVSTAAQPEGEQVTISAEGECDTPEAAQKLAAGLEFVRAIVHGSLSNPNSRGAMTPETAAAADHLLTGVRITNEASRVRLLVTVTQEMLRTPTRPITPPQTAAPGASPRTTGPKAPPAGQVR